MDEIDQLQRDIDQLMERLRTDPLSRRLLADPDLKSVWKKLSDKRRYPQGAVALLLEEILDIKKRLAESRANVGRKPMPGLPTFGLVSRPEAEKARKHWEKMATALTEDWLLFGHIFSDDPERTRCLAEAAQFYTTFASEQATEINFAVIDRNTRDGEARFFAIALCRFFRLAFKKRAAQELLRS
jgi:hypothetical protein